MLELWKIRSSTMVSDMAKLDGDLFQCREIVVLLDV